MPRREQFVNNAVTTLNGAITAAATTITVSDGSVFPSEGDFRIIVNDEIMLVTARSTNDLTVQRGVDGTSGAIQASGSNVRAILTASGIDQYVDDATAGYSDRYPFRFLDDAATTLTSSDFTWVNQGSANVSDDTWGGITMTLPSATAFNLRAMVMTAPAAPWTLTGRVMFGPGYKVWDTSEASMIGICARENSTGKIQACGLRMDNTVGAFQFTNATTLSGTLGTAAAQFTDQIWMQLEDDNSTMTVRCSTDGINWFQLGSEARGTFPTGSAMDQVGFFADSGGGSASALFHFQSWVLE